MKCGTTPHNDTLFTLKFSLIHNPSKVKMLIWPLLHDQIPKKIISFPAHQPQQ